MTEKNVMKGMNEDTQFLAMVIIAAAQANTDNVNKLVGYA